MLAMKSDGRKRKIAPFSTKLPLYQQINDRCNLLHLPPGYTISPSQAQIISNKFIAKNLTISYKSTTALWRGIISLKNLKAPLADLIQLGRTHIEVYRNEELKPLAGSQLNQTCFVTFTNLKKIKEQKLRLTCQENNCELISYLRDSNTFTVEIPHFTRYVFKNVEEVSSDEEVHVPPTQRQPNSTAPGTLVDNIRSNQMNRTVQENMELRTSFTAMQSSIIKQTLRSPTRESLEEVRKHNISMKHKLQESRLRGAINAIGINSIIQTKIHSPTLHRLQFNFPSPQKSNLLTSCLDMMINQCSISTYIIKSDLDMATKRTLSLYLILFNFKLCMFKFQRTSEHNLQIVETNRAPEDHHQSLYCKNWFEWVVAQDFKPKHDTEVQLLATRNINSLADKFNQFQLQSDYEFVSSIEDEMYRNGDPPQNICKQLKSLHRGELTYFQSYPWIVKFAVYLWYCSFNANPNQKLIQILNNASLQKDGYLLQHEILSIYLKQKFCTDKLSYVQPNEYPLWWLISNKLSAQQSENTGSEYLHYRFNLLMELTQKFQDTKIAIELISHDNFLSPSHKMNVFRVFADRNVKEGEIVSVCHYSNSIYNSQAYLYYSEQDYLKALECFSQCSKITLQAQQVLKRILTKQEIILGFSNKSIQSTKAALEKIKTIPFRDQGLKIDTYIMLLNTQLGEEPMDPVKVKSMLTEICLENKNPRFKKRLCGIVFKEAMKSPKVITELKKKSPFFEPDNSKKLTFEQYMQNVFSEPAYILQIKMAKLQM